MPRVSFPLRFPLQLGGPEDLHAVEHQAVLGALQDYYNVDSAGGVWCQAYADATALAFVWACNRRLANQRNPLKMTDALSDWEQACGLVPTIGDSEVDRRNRLAAKMAGLIGNAIADIDRSCQQALGQSYGALVITPPALQVTYWPGVNPGPPGREWSSNRARIAIVVTNPGFDDETLRNQLSALSSLLQSLLPVWAVFDVDPLGYVL